MSKPELIVLIPPLVPEGSRTLQAQARQGDVLAAINIWPYGTGEYVLESYWDRTSSKIRRKLTPGQDERGLALLQVLRERLTSALEAAGWQCARPNYEGKPLWRFIGPAKSTPSPTLPAGASEQQQAGSMPVPAPARSALPSVSAPLSPPVPGPPDQEQPPVASKRIAVAGGKQPRKAYSRMLSTRWVTFTCLRCGKSVSQQRYPGPKPRYCPQGCREEATREQNRARVQQFRERKRTKK